MTCRARPSLATRPSPLRFQSGSLRLVSEGLILVVALSLGVAAAPARARERGTRTTRGAATRSLNGSQRWDLHGELSELPLHDASYELGSVAQAAGSADSPSHDDESSTVASPTRHFDGARRGAVLRPAPSTRAHRIVLGSRQTRAPPRVV